MLDEAIRQIREAKENGAVGVCLRPFEGDKFLIHSYFYPIFEEAERLDMPIAVHIANASPFYRSLFESVFENAGGFNIFRVPTVMVCLGLIASEVPQLFPKLRWAFIEASAMWMPWIWNEVAQRFLMMKSISDETRSMPMDLFKEYNIFVTCQTDDDLPWVLPYSGEHSLVIGTDYGHFDPSSEIGAIEVFKQDDRISQETKDRILHYNPKALYGL
jgi:predicted TIM-barrel fold metal-dependent hydrolase